MSATVDDLDRPTRSPARPRTQEPFRFEARIMTGSWPTTLRGRDEVVALMASLPFTSKADEKHRALGVNLMADWLGEQPGGTWQERWVSSGADAAGHDWRHLPAIWLRLRCDHFDGHRAALVAAVTVAVCADVVRPSLSWLAGGGFGQGGLLVRHLAVSRDVKGFARLRTRCDSDPGVSAMSTSRMMYRCSLIMAAKGGALADITVGCW